MAADRTPTTRFGRSAKIGGLVAGQGARVAGGKMLDKARSDEAREKAQRKRTAAVVETQVAESNRPAARLFDKLGFEAAEHGTVYRRREPS